MILALEYDRVRGEKILKGDSLDLGCGDGLFTFSLLGGQVQKDFDVYHSIAPTDHYYDKKDMFNHFDSGRYSPRLTKKPRTIIDVGVDLNNSMLRKASALGFYKSLVRHDMGVAFPFKDGSFSNILGLNSLIYSTNLTLTFNEIERVAKKGSKIILFMPGDKVKEYRIYNQYSQFGQKWAYYIDRMRMGYGGVEETLISFGEYEQLIEAAGLRIQKHEFVISEGCYRAWDVGFRLIFPMLVKMLEKVPKKDVAAVKEYWVDQEYKLFSSYITYEAKKECDEESTFHYFILTK